MGTTSSGCYGRATLTQFYLVILLSTAPAWGSRTIRTTPLYWQDSLYMNQTLTAANHYTKSIHLNLQNLSAFQQSGKATVMVQPSQWQFNSCSGTVLLDNINAPIGSDTSLDLPFSVAANTSKTLTTFVHFRESSACTMNGAVALEALFQVSIVIDDNRGAMLGNLHTFTSCSGGCMNVGSFTLLALAIASIAQPTNYPINSGRAF